MFSTLNSLMRQFLEHGSSVVLPCVDDGTTGQLLPSVVVVEPLAFLPRLDTTPRLR